jgi:hypothetical protein
MKRYRCLFLLIVLVGLLGCRDKGHTTMVLNGGETGLPMELQGIKVYTIKDSPITYVKVAILNGQVNSLTYPVGKTTQTTIILNTKKGTRVIESAEILSETDSIIVIKK